MTTPKRKPLYYSFPGICHRRIWFWGTFTQDEKSSLMKIGFAFRKG